MHLEVEVGDDEIEHAVAVVVARVDAHPGARLAVGADRDARGEPGFGELHPAAVVEQEVRHRVVRDEHIRLAVVVVVRDDDAHAVAAKGADA